MMMGSLQDYLKWGAARGVCTGHRVSVSMQIENSSPYNTAHTISVQYHTGQYNSNQNSSVYNLVHHISSSTSNCDHSCTRNNLLLAFHCFTMSLQQLTPHLGKQIRVLISDGRVIEGEFQVRIWYSLLMVLLVVIT